MCQAAEHGAEAAISAASETEASAPASPKAFSTTVPLTQRVPNTKLAVVTNHAGWAAGEYLAKRRRKEMCIDS